MYLMPFILLCYISFMFMKCWESLNKAPFHKHYIDPSDNKVAWSLWLLENFFNFLIIDRLKWTWCRTPYIASSLFPLSNIYACNRRICKKKNTVLRPEYTILMQRWIRNRKISWPFAVRVALGIWNGANSLWEDWRCEAGERERKERTFSWVLPPNSAGEGRCVCTSRRGRGRQQLVGTVWSADTSGVKSTTTRRLTAASKAW